MFLDEVRVPVGNRVGAENDGWRVTMVTLSFERGTAFVGEVVACRRVLGALARAARANGRWDDAVLRRRLGRLHAEFAALWRLIQWNVSEAMGGPPGAGGRAGGGGVPGIGGSVFKLRYSHVRQELYDTAAQVLGAGALDADHEWAADRLVPLVHHRGRYLADPAEHRRRADPRPAEGAVTGRWTSNSPMTSGRCRTAPASCWPGGSAGNGCGPRWTNRRWTARCGASWERPGSLRCGCRRRPAGWGSGCRKRCWSSRRPGARCCRGRWWRASCWPGRWTGSRPARRPSGSARRSGIRCCGNTRRSAMS